MKLMPILMLMAILAGCATEASKTSPPSESKKNVPLAVIGISKNLPSSSGDCPVSVKISNRMQGTAWDGASYHVSVVDRKNVSIGQVIGAPHQFTKPGSDLAETAGVLGVKCENIAGVSLLYFAYYPSGKNPVHLHNSEVKAELR